MHSYCSNNAVTVLNAAKSSKTRSTVNFKNSKFTRISSASQPAVRPGFASATALEFLHNKGNRVGFIRNCCSEERLSTVPWCFLLSFIS